MRANASEPPGGIRTASDRRQPAIPFWKLASAAFGYKRRTPRPRTSTVRALMAAPTCPARVAQAPHLSMAAPAPAPRPSRPGTLPLRARARTSPRLPHFPMSTPRAPALAGTSAPRPRAPALASASALLPRVHRPDTPAPWPHPPRTPRPDTPLPRARPRPRPTLVGRVGAPSPETIAFRARSGRLRRQRGTRADDAASRRAGEKPSPPLRLR